MNKGAAWTASVVAITAIILFSYVALAATSDVTATAGVTNVAPTVGAAQIGDSSGDALTSTDAGSTIYVNATIDDNNGLADITADGTVRVECWISPASEDDADSWDSYGQTTNSTTCEDDGAGGSIGTAVESASGDGIYGCSVALNNQVQDGTLNCEVIAWDGANTEVEGTADTVTTNTRTSIAIQDTTCGTTANVNPTSNDNLMSCESASAPGWMNVTHDGNIGYNISAAITTTLTSGGNTIADANVYQCALNETTSDGLTDGDSCDTLLGSGLTNAECTGTDCYGTEAALSSSQTIVNDFERDKDGDATPGTYKTNRLFSTYVVDVPDSTPSGTYTGTIRVTYVAA